MLQHLKSFDDANVAADLMRVGIVRGGRVDLECALVLLPLLTRLFETNEEDIKLIAVEAFMQLCLMFGSLIRNTRAVTKDMLGVDLNAEARQQRCQAAHEHFAGLVPRMKQLSDSRGALGRAASELLKALCVQLGLSS